MKNRSTISAVPATVDNNDPPTPLPIPRHNQNDFDELQPVSSRKRGFPLYLFIIGCLLVLLVMNSIRLNQYKQYFELSEQEAYALSVSINLLEDNLLMRYGVLPEDLGLAELRSAWISNPCRETTRVYHEALSNALTYFEEGITTAETYDPIPV